MVETAYEDLENIPQIKGIIGERYELGKLIGRGAFAKVYHARDIQTGQAVAIKCVNKHSIVRNGLTTQIKREISIMSRLHHENIVQLYEVKATKTKIYFVMEYERGGELFSKVNKARFSEDLSRKYFRQLITGVEYCHTRGVYHRDLKPENLLLDANWNLKISDFGLSAIKDQIGTDGLLHTQCGTPAYVAPEILTKKGYDGAKIDVWSCGVILYVLIAGYLPFNDRNLMNLYQKIYNGEFLFPKWVSPDLRRFIQRLLDPNPETRITIPEIVIDPWFTDTQIEVKLNCMFDESDVKAGDVKKCLNAFDIISFSSGIDLSALLDISGSRFAIVERFVSNLLPGRIREEIEMVAGTAEGVVVVRTSKDWGLKLRGQNGNFVIMIGLERLTEELVVVEISQRTNVRGLGYRVWRNEIRPKLVGLIYEPERV